MTSVHLQDFPLVEDLPEDGALVQAMDRVRDACNVALSIRNQANLRVRLPLANLTIVAEGADALSGLVGLIKDEVNVKEVKFSNDVAAHADFSLKINFPVLGKRLPQKMKTIIAASKQGQWEQNANGKIVICDEELLPEECNLALVPKAKVGAAPLSTNDALVVLDLDVNEDLRIEGVARDLVRSIQQSRKDADLQITDRIALVVGSEHADIEAALSQFGDYIGEQTLAVSVEQGEAVKSSHHFTQKVDDKDVVIGFSVAV